MSPLRRGAHESWWTADQGFFNAVANTIPTYRVLDEEGRPVKGAVLPEITKEEALKMYAFPAIALTPATAP
jgi:2-oxoisovalerate dehydrogenase E1 component alpha subunit